MGQLLHGSTRTTAALRRTIQLSQESIARRVGRYDLNAKTVAINRTSKFAYAELHPVKQEEDRDED